MNAINKMADRVMELVTAAVEKLTALGYTIVETRSDIPEIDPLALLMGTAALVTSMESIELDATITAKKEADNYLKKLRATKETMCPKCNGTGHLPQFEHIAAGVCFHCYGKGHMVEYKYTDAEMAAV